MSFADLGGTNLAEFGNEFVNTPAVLLRYADESIGIYLGIAGTGVATMVASVDITATDVFCLCIADSFHNSIFLSLSKRRIGV